MTLAWIASGLAGVVFANAVMALGVQAQGTPPPSRIGVLHAAFAINHPSFEGFKDGLADAGFVEGRDIAFDVRFTSGVLEAYSDAARSVVADGAKLIFAISEPAVRAAREVAGERPIVFAAVGDPVAAGIVKSIPRPQGNVTGVSSLSTDLMPKRLEILQQISPDLRRVHMVYNSGDPQAVAAARLGAEAAPQLGMEFIGHPVRTTEELAAALATFEPNDGCVTIESALLDISDQVLQRSLAIRMATIYSSAFWVRHGALVAFGADYYDMGRQAARLAAKILRGAKPEDIPVEGANAIHLTINLGTAKTLGIGVPPALMIRADEVIE